MSKWKRVEEHFLDWLSENREHFVVEPCVTRTDKRSVRFGFAGIRSEINAVCYESSRYGCISIAADYQGECWDLLADFDVSLRRLSSGDYFCKLCHVPGRKYFRSRQELLVNHLFEPLLEWANKYLTPLSWLCFFTIEGGGATWAKIIEKDQIESDEEFTCLVHSFPVYKPA
jgi:hypothetical protein